MLINDLLDLSKIEAGKLNLTIADVDLRDIVDESSNILRKQAREEGVDLHSEISEEARAMRGDELRIRQIMVNLISNAVKFTQSGGSIRVRAETKEPGWVDICVSDTGVGLVSQDLGRVFEPFEQVGNTRSTKREGTGLGLSLTKRLVELHGGRIWAESDGPGKGSRFHVVLPTALSL